MTEHPSLNADDLRDDYSRADVTRHETVYRGRVWDVVQEDFTHPTGTLTRDFVRHPGAVAVLALRGGPGAEEMLVIQQYRHPIGAQEWEIPAGLLDVTGEPPHVGALRELYEEADLRAGRLDVLIDYASSPGGLSEQMRVYLARDISVVPVAERFERDAEEVGMPTAWVALDTVLEAIMNAQVHNPTLIIAAFAADRARRSNFDGLRAADAPWPTHPRFAANGVS